MRGASVILNAASATASPPTRRVGMPQVDARDVPTTASPRLARNDANGDTMSKHLDYNPGPRVGITFSTFDLLHAGHIMMLAEAKRQCDYLICGLQMDPTLDRPEKNAPTQTVVERYIQLRGCEYVDEIVPYSTEQDLEDILRSFKLDVRIVGDEYQDKDFTGRAYCEESGIELYFNRRDHRFSSSGLRRIVADREAQRTAAL